jgi:hypothetical protein
MADEAGGERRSENIADRIKVVAPADAASRYFEDPTPSFRRAMREVLPSFAAGLGVLSVLFVITLAFGQRTEYSRVRDYLRSSAPDPIVVRRLIEDLNTERAKRRELEERLRRIEASASPASAALGERITRLEAAQARINETIIASPEKALETPLIRRDVTELRNSTTESVAVLRREIDRLYNLNATFVIGLAVAIFSFGLFNYLTTRKEKAGT